MPDPPVYTSAIPPPQPPEPAALPPSLASALPAAPPSALSAPALMTPTIQAPSAPPFPIIVPLPAAAAPASLFSIQGGTPSTRSTFHRSPEEMWVDHMTELEQWAKANQKDARNDAFAFWALKIPAIIASASAGICAQYHLTNVSLFAAAIASFCVIVDGIQPRGMLRNTHLRAFHDIRFLTSHMMTQFRSSEDPPESAVRKIIRESEPERKRIAAYIRDAETALKPSQKV